jgi:hypothetical protein
MLMKHTGLAAFKLGLPSKLSTEGVARWRGTLAAATHPPRFDASKTSWLGRWFLFQTFEDLDSIKDKSADIQQIRSLLDEKDADQDGQRIQ